MNTDLMPLIGWLGASPTADAYRGAITAATDWGCLPETTRSEVGTTWRPTPTLEREKESTLVKATRTATKKMKDRNIALAAVVTSDEMTISSRETVGGFLLDAVLFRSRYWPIILRGRLWIINGAVGYVRRYRS